MALLLGTTVACYMLFRNIKQQFFPDSNTLLYFVHYQLQQGASIQQTTQGLRGLPLSLIVMVLISILLFNGLKQPLIIWALVPMAVNGVSLGLLGTGLPFTFTALLGLLSLSGMLIKNGIVLVDEIDLTRKDDPAKPLDDAVAMASSTRLRPVMPAELTTILGMARLLTDAFFQSMAVTIMGGLAFASILTLIAAPIFYYLLFARADARLSDTQVETADQTIATETIIWAAGVRASPAAEWLDCEVGPNGRIMVDGSLRPVGHDNIYVVGDVARYEQDGVPLPGIAPVAKQMGPYVGTRLAKAAVRKDARDLFRYADAGALATIGRNRAVADIYGLQLAGFLGWLLWGAAHVYFLIGFKNRLFVTLQWAWAYLTWQRGVRLIMDRKKGGS